MIFWIVKRLGFIRNLCFFLEQYFARTIFRFQHGNAELSKEHCCADMFSPHFTLLSPARFLAQAPHTALPSTTTMDDHYALTQLRLLRDGGVTEATIARLLPEVFREPADQPENLQIGEVGLLLSHCEPELLCSALRLLNVSDILAARSASVQWQRCCGSDVFLKDNLACSHEALCRQSSTLQGLLAKATVFGRAWTAMRVEMADKLTDDVLLHMLAPLCPHIERVYLCWSYGNVNISTSTLAALAKHWPSLEVLDYIADPLRYAASHPNLRQLKFYKQPSDMHGVVNLLQKSCRHINDLYLRYADVSEGIMHGLENACAGRLVAISFEECNLCPALLSLVSSCASSLKRVHIIACSGLPGDMYSQILLQCRFLEDFGISGSAAMGVSEDFLQPFLAAEHPSLTCLGVANCYDITDFTLQCISHGFRHTLSELDLSYSCGLLTEAAIVLLCTSLPHLTSATFADEDLTTSCVDSLSRVFEVQVTAFRVRCTCARKGS